MSIERSESEIFIRPAMESEVKSVSEFLAKHFSPNNPMEVAYIYQKDNQKREERSDDGEERKRYRFTLKAIMDGNVLVAIKLSTLVGVSISDIINSKSDGYLIPPTEPTSSCEDGNRAVDIPNFLAYISAKANIRQRYDVDEYLQIEIVGVHQDYRQHNIGKKLFEASIDLAKAKNCEVVSVDCTNIYSSKIAEKLGMDCVSTVSYDEYSDHLGKCLFVSIPPNTEIKTFAKKIRIIETNLHSIFKLFYDSFGPSINYPVNGSTIPHKSH